METIQVQLKSKNVKSRGFSMYNMDIEDCFHYLTYFAKSVEDAKLRGQKELDIKVVLL